METIEFLISHILEKRLKINNNDNYSLFFVESPIYNRDFRLKTIELIFEKFGMHSAFIHKSSILSSFFPF